MGSADPGDRRRWRRLRAVLRWSPAALLAAVVATAAVVVVGYERTPRSARAATRTELTTPILSLRRQLDPLRDAAAVHRLRAGLDAFLAGQPEDTCLEVDVGDVRYSHRSDDPQAPASLEKLLTAVAALSELGPDHTFVTEALAPPPAAGVVEGNLYLRGGGDPILATAPYVARERNQPQIFSDVDQLADAIVAAGIRTVTGSVVGDESRYDTERYHPDWPRRFLAQGQIGPVSALAVNDGFAYFADVDDPGTFGAAADPAAYAATVVDAALRARGVTIAGPPSSGPTPADLPVLADHESPPLEQIVTEMLQESDNNTAEMLLKELGLARSDSGSFDAGHRAVTEILADEGIDLEGVAVADGSGLAPTDQVTCDLLVDLLDHDPTEAIIRDALPVAGESGTLARRWRGTALVGQVRAKTGTLNQVTGLAGFVTATEGEVRFALLVNVPTTEAVQSDTILAQEQLAELLLAHPARPDVDALRPGGGG